MIFVPKNKRKVNQHRNALREIKHKMDKVAYILERYPETRNSDNYLCVMYWKLVDRVDSLEGIVGATAPEVIRRARQKFNERGEYLATDPDVLKRRRQNEKAMRAGISKI